MAEESTFSIKVLNISSSFNWGNIFGIPDALKIRFFVKAPWIKFERDTFAAFSELLSPIEGLFEYDKYSFGVGTGLPMQIEWQDKGNISLTIGYNHELDKLKVSKNYVFTIILNFKDFFNAVKEAADFVINELESRPNSKEDPEGKKELMEHYHKVIGLYENWEKQQKK